MRDTDLPDLTFPMVRLGTMETPWDLLGLLYRGGAAARPNHVSALIAGGDLGIPVPERIALVQRIHSEIASVLVSGGGKETARSRIYCVRRFFAWADDGGAAMTLDTVIDVFVHWTDYLLHRQRVVRDLNERGVYQLAKSVAAVLDRVLERRISVLSSTRIRKPRYNRLARDTGADRQSLAQSFVFGHALVDICDALTVESIHGPPPVRIPLRSGKVLEEWSVRSRADARQPQYRLINLRIEAELLLFIAQTGLNRSQAHTARVGHFHYTSHLDGYQVRRYKHRRQGEVEFEIYREYRELFERYLTWRAAIFPDDPDGLLFPFVRHGRAEDAPPRFTGIRTVCRRLGITFVSPRPLRKLRINWLLRELHDPALAAEMAQHAQQTLLRDYLEPNAHVAMVEISRFHRQSDPDIAMPGPGRCVSPVPAALPGTPPQATQPDCVSAAGCLFCVHHRDIDSEDHVWSLASFRHLKSLELARGHPSPPDRRISPALHPAALAIARLAAKLKFYERSSVVRGQWVREALLRIEEGAYHPAWRAFIQLAGDRP
ncbi:Phage integrase family protein [Paraburkholderia piptadeniae]|uniref:Phage integrase family protein n=1 Tax=Paraburkholderia piptadeniae TaxID=1701573 RepID=A0A1N7SF11_9BURK|nr:integrase [Paraburkholderia piptadeniae]SIT45930.1 Phage integrase family protein [Paraburkholderia piptadeniae]